MKSFLVMLFLTFPLKSVAEDADEPVETGETMEVVEVTEETAEPDAPAEDTRIDRTKRQLDTQVQRAAQWVDSFYGDPNYEAEVATTQLRIRPEFYYRKEQGRESQRQGLFEAHAAQHGQQDQPDSR